MPIPNSEQYGAMLDRASVEHYALPAINVTSSETLNGAVRGLAEAGSVAAFADSMNELFERLDQAPVAA
jgi:fructose/tagatose bisphosphate aldolase